MKLGKNPQEKMAPLDLLREGAGIAGGILVSYGSWDIYHPAGVIVAGVLLIVVAERLARAELLSGGDDE